MQRDRRQSLAHSSLSALGVGLLLLAGSACRELPRTPGRGVVVLTEGNLAQLKPADVAVAPVEVRPGVKAPADLLRRAIAQGLPRRHYSPIALDYVDSRLTDAAYSPGAVGEEAVCQVTVSGWNERYWDTGHAIEVDVELTMIDPENPDGQPLWSGRLTRKIDVADLVDSTVEASLYEAAVNRVARELLAALPERDTSYRG